MYSIRNEYIEMIDMCLEKLEELNIQTRDIYEMVYKKAKFYFPADKSLINLYLHRFVPNFFKY